MDDKLIKDALDFLVDKDSSKKKVLEKAIKAVGYPETRHRQGGFHAFIKIIIAQQISVQAANGIGQKLFTTYPNLTPQQCVDLSLDDFRKCGLSYRKAEYIKSLGDAIVDNSFPIDELHKMEDEKVIKTITSLRGFGIWSAEIYCMFSLNRQDIFPANDLALQEAFKRLFNKNQRPNESELRKLTLKYKPYRSVFALFLWHYYKVNPL